MWWRLKLLMVQSECHQTLMFMRDDQLQIKRAMADERVEELHPEDFRLQSAYGRSDLAAAVVIDADGDDHGDHGTEDELCAKPA